MNKQLSYLMTICLVLCSGGSAFAQWTATIHAEGQDLGGVKAYDVVIGVGESRETEDAPPAPPSYSVKMEIIALDWFVKYLREIRQVGDTEYLWIISINPHGNIGPPADRSSTLSWDPSEFGPGTLELIADYPDALGDVVVEDMRTTTSHVVTGGDSDQYFTIRYTPGGQGPIGSVVGRIMDSMGNPIENALVETDWAGADTRSLGNGYFTLIVPAGTHSLTITAAAYGPLVRSNTAVCASCVVDLGDITLGPKGDINADGNVDSLDLSFIVDCIFGQVAPTREEFNAANVDSANQILDIDDLLRMIDIVR